MNSNTSLPIDLNEPVVVVSNDTHIGPRLVEDLRPYCPAGSLADFDEFAMASAQDKADAAAMLGGSGYLDHPNLRTAGHHDAAARLADYDLDGVAAGVIFHGSMNMEPIPFIASGLAKSKALVSQDLAAVGMSIYNRWLADFVAAAPHRHVGLAYLPMWDVDAAVAEVRWAHAAGLRGVNFPAMRDGELPEYNRSQWEPLWSVCEELGMPLVTHVGAGTGAKYSKLEGVALLQYESGAFTSRRAVWWLILAGVFERHPGLKLVITETPGNWFPSTAAELDSLWDFYDTKRGQPLNDALLAQVPKRPSEYMASNVFFGASFASAHEVREAVSHGIESQLMWGSDYPHIEGTFVYPDGGDLPSVTRLALRNTFCDVPPAETLRMVGQNAIEVYGLDARELQRIARDINAPTLHDLATPIDGVPAEASITAFRAGDGGWG
jgi:predicted TIM-barrel fold metal-dependent hydrolase